MTENVTKATRLRLHPLTWWERFYLAPDHERVAYWIHETGGAAIQWDSFGKRWSVWAPWALGVDTQFLELGPRAYNRLILFEPIVGGDS